jgi:hypothetical protein
MDPESSVMANASSPSLVKTSSSCLAQGITAAHNFEVINLSLLEGMGAGERVHSRNFSVGDYDWSIFLYPEGITTAHADKSVGLLESS